MNLTRACVDLEENDTAAMLRRGRDDDRHRARDLLDASIATASEIGQAGVERDARTLMSAL